MDLDEHRSQEDNPTAAVLRPSPISSMSIAADLFCREADRWKPNRAIRFAVSSGMSAPIIGTGACSASAPSSKGVVAGTSSGLFWDRRTIRTRRPGTTGRSSLPPMAGSIRSSRAVASPSGGARTVERFSSPAKDTVRSAKVSIERPRTGNTGKPRDRRATINPKNTPEKPHWRYQKQGCKNGGVVWAGLGDFGNLTVAQATLFERIDYV